MSFFNTKKSNSKSKFEGIIDSGFKAIILGLFRISRGKNYMFVY